MIGYIKIIQTVVFIIAFCNVQAQTILPGAYQTKQYFHLLQNKKVAVFANHTSYINKTHLVDTLVKSNINVVKIFAPEHGFRGLADAGEKVNNQIDSTTHIPIISLYGKYLKPSSNDLLNVDVLLFDIQDVGVRFYTYISSLQYFIEAAIENDKPLIILDRPNPNGFYIDGEVLDTAFKSFVGMQPIPIVYGMTIAEYAKMLVGENWLDWKYIRKIDNKTSLQEMLGFEEKHKKFSLKIVKCKNYKHSSKYILPISPSPNLPNMQSVYWYPTIALFEGTVFSEGRGTNHPFCVYGHPSLSKYKNTQENLDSFIPKSKYGAKEPKFKNTICYGWNVYNENIVNTLQQINGRIKIECLIKAYQLFKKSNSESFFIKPKSEFSTDYFFNKLAGSDNLKKQLELGNSSEQIFKTWQPAINKFKKIRKKYLLYEDF